jgi:hypothetical protein
MGDQVMTYPSRYFVNISSHVEWYRERGVTVQPIMVVRDPVFHFQGILNVHCKNYTAALQQYDMGREIMLQSLTTSSPIIVSYETLMTLQQPYLDELFDKLEINSTYKPKFKNGNLKYVANKTSPEPITELLMGVDKGLNISRGRGRRRGRRGTPPKRPWNATAHDASYGAPQGDKGQTSRTTNATSSQQPGSLAASS